MLKDMVRAEWKTDIRYEVTFDRGDGSGYGFPCDEKGNYLPGLTDAAKKNLAYCLNHPEEFEQFNEVVAIKNEYKEPAHGKCTCGNEVVLVDEYFGACQCERCGRWYNLFGQELNPPEMWEEDLNDYEYDYAWD